MTTSKELSLLLDRLTEVSPPPRLPLGINAPIVEGSGKWVTQPSGAGGYVVRARYQTRNGGEVIVRVSDELRGAPSVIAKAVRFAIQLAESDRRYWVLVS